MTTAGAAVTHTTAETLFVEAAGVEFAYRSFGSPTEVKLNPAGPAARVDSPQPDDGVPETTNLAEGSLRPRDS
jgi:hypothetical protein